jgi:hypothetical protein
MITTVVSSDYWQNNEEAKNNEETDKKVLMLPPIKSASVSIKYTKCGEAFQNDICKQECSICAWYVKNKNLMEEKENG